MINCVIKDNLTEKEIIARLLRLMKNAIVPISGYQVGAIARVKISGESFYCCGVNVENSEHRLSTHGEEGVLATMLTSFGRHARIEELWVVGGGKDSKPDAYASCCGKCRQQVAEYCDANTPINYVSLNGNVLKVTMGAELPHLFSFSSYVTKPLATANEKLQDWERRLVRVEEQKPDEIFKWLRSLDGVDYVSKTMSSAILRLNGGAYVAGVSMEDAAFINISAIQAAAAVAAEEFGEVGATELHYYGRGFGSSDLPMPSLAELQVLSELSDSGKLACYLYDAEGRRRQYDMAELCAMALKYTSGKSKA